ncbi:MAG: glutaredoxin family protein [Thermoanaerobaculia bacterium]|nr:glutaredoxin family protein [Thermoanaerobaculia bacterium]
MKRAVLATCLLAAVCAPAPGGADWLVLRDGTRLETRGVPKVEGRRVTFTDARGVWVALAASEVDLAATEAANRVEEAAAPKPSPRAPVLRLTDDDVGHAGHFEQPTILFYSASWCGSCRRSRVLLDQLGARYDERDVEEDPAARRAKERLVPGPAVPVIAFGDIVLTGFSERGIRRMVETWRKAESAAQEAYEASRDPAAAPR